MAAAKAICYNTINITIYHKQNEEKRDMQDRKTAPAEFKIVEVIENVLNPKVQSTANTATTASTANTATTASTANTATTASTANAPRLFSIVDLRKQLLLDPTLLEIVNFLSPLLYSGKITFPLEKLAEIASQIKNENYTEQQFNNLASLFSLIKGGKLSLPKALQMVKENKNETIDKLANTAYLILTNVITMDEALTLDLETTRRINKIDILIPKIYRLEETKKMSKQLLEGLYALKALLAYGRIQRKEISNFTDKQTGVLYRLTPLILANKLTIQDAIKYTPDQADILASVSHAIINNKLSVSDGKESLYDAGSKLIDEILDTNNTYADEGRKSFRLFDNLKIFIYTGILTLSECKAWVENLKVQKQNEALAQALNRAHPLVLANAITLEELSQVLKNNKLTLLAGIQPYQLGLIYKVAEDHLQINLENIISVKPVAAIIQEYHNLKFD